MVCPDSPKSSISGRFRSAGVRQRAAGVDSHTQTGVILGTEAHAEDPAYRYESCLEFVDALRAGLAPSPLTPRPAVMVRRRPRRTPLALGTALAVGALAFVLTAALTDGHAASRLRRSC
jgi:hypothetical protein